MIKMTTVKNLAEAIKLTNHYEEIIRTQYKRLIQNIYKNLKKFSMVQNKVD